MKNKIKTLAFLGLAILGLGSSEVFAAPNLFLWGWTEVNTPNSIVAQVSGHFVGISNDADLCGTISTPCDIKAEVSEVLQGDTGVFTIRFFVVQGTILGSVPVIPDLVQADYQGNGNVSQSTRSGSGKTQTANGLKTFTFTFTVVPMCILSPNAQGTRYGLPACSASPGNPGSLIAEIDATVNP